MKNRRGYKTVMSRIIAQHLEMIDNEAIMRKVSGFLGAKFIPTSAPIIWGRTG